MTLCVMTVHSARAVTPLGQDVTNIAVLDYEQDGTPVSVRTNAATFTVSARPTPSTIEFLRYAPNAVDSVPVVLNGADYSPTGESNAETFVPIGPAIAPGGQIIDTSLPVPLLPANTYFTGELMVVRVVDLGQNGDPDRIETLTVEVRSSAGDVIVLRLYESGPDTGAFLAWLPSTGGEAVPHDPALSAPKESELTARYVDIFDATEVSIDTALVDPYGRLFDSLSGELLDGAQVTIVDAATGAPAEVFGIDGRSPYPSTLITGSSVTDEGGAVYDLDEGEFLFPLMAPGDYRLEIIPPGDYAFPSGLPADSFFDLPNGPFVIIEGSYGSTFTVESTGPLNFDVPLDTNRGLSVTKTSTNSTASIGDFIAYSVQVQNQETASLPLRIKDILPRGMRYVDDSARVEGQPDPVGILSADGKEVTFQLDRIEAGATVILTYVLSVGPGTPLGEAENSAIAVTPLGSPMSNVAKAVVQIREDLLRSQSFIVGRVAENACDGEDEWARALHDGVGVEGVRIYLETGEYVVSDADGLFHFEGVEPGTHVVQVDEETLPHGYAPMVCEENSRYAGSATSKFVDVRGGAVWRANFYLQRSDAPRGPTDALATAADTNETAFDQAWLDTAGPGTAWAYPNVEETPAQRSVDLGIKAPDTSSVSLFLNGREVSALNRQRRVSSTDRQTSLFRWRGVDIQRGQNVFEVGIEHADGRTETLTRSVWFVDEALRARLVDDQSVLVADGRTPPVLAVRLEDAEGRPVHPGLIADVSVAAPYRKLSEADIEGSDAVARTEIETTGSVVDGSGIVHIELEPTLVTGRVRIEVPLSDGRIEEISAYLRPEKRDWIVVGLAEGEGGYLDTDELSPVNEEDLYTDGRFALFAKGMVRGDWLLTLAVDTAKRRGARDDEVFDQIDPNAFYTLYGDRSVQYQEAPSQYPVYVKLERDTAQILFGDFNTDLRDSELAQYSRRLSGLRAIHAGEQISATVFAAETNQGFVKDEIAADGTSGPYMLSRAPIVRSSEELFIEVRDRVRPDQVLSRRQLVRFVDYDIDYETGRLLFRAPVDATDAAFNEQVIVVDYEAVSDAERNLTYGGRAALTLNDGAIEVGVSHIHEDGSIEAADAESELTGIDFRGRLGEQTQVRAEYASSISRPGAEGTNKDSGEAWLLEVAHQRERVAAVAYAREEEGGFGLGQTGTNTLGIRRYGAEVSALVGDSVNVETGNRRTRTLRAGAYREDSLTEDANRTVGEMTLQQRTALGTMALGVRSVDETTNGAPRESVLATATVSRTLPDLGLTLTASREQPLGGKNSDEVSAFPGRTLIGVDKQLTPRATLNVRHEQLEGDNASGQNTVVGVTVLPWIGGRLTTGLSNVTQDSGQRLSATVGVDQTLRLSDTWSMSIGAADRSQIDGEGDPLDPFADDAVSPLAEGERSALTLDESFTSAYLGLAYRSEKQIASLRGEMRESLDSQRYAAILGGAREVTQELSYAGAVRYQSETGAVAGGRQSVDARLGAALRPRGDGTVFFNRLDLGYQDQPGTARDWRIVNNFTANTMLTDRTQLAGFLGAKYVETELADVNVSGWTGLVGGELRHDLSERFDVGLQGLVMHGSESKTTEIAFGPSVGFSPRDNVWMSLGYNFSGFVDRDFEAAEYSDEGVFVKLRLKFDQDDVDGLLSRVSPR
ncbi:MAG: hypothetical protein AAF829_05615 [Pseudomonadota bacterium]